MFYGFFLKASLRKDKDNFFKKYTPKVGPVSLQVTLIQITKQYKSTLLDQGDDTRITFDQPSRNFSTPVNHSMMPETHLDCVSYCQYISWELYRHIWSHRLHDHHGHQVHSWPISACSGQKELEENLGSSTFFVFSSISSDTLVPWSPWVTRYTGWLSQLPVFKISQF